VKREFHARFCERRRVRFPPPTHLETHPGGTDRPPNTEEVRGGREGHTSVLRTAVGVEDRSLGERIISGGHSQGVDHQVGAEVVGHGVTNAGFGVAVDDGGEIQPALPSRNIGIMRSCT
jgi:hypothetical protein